MLSPRVASRFITRLCSLNGWSPSLNNTGDVDDLFRVASEPVRSRQSSSFLKLEPLRCGVVVLGTEDLERFDGVSVCSSQLPLESQLSCSTAEPPFPDGSRTVSVNESSQTKDSGKDSNPQPSPQGGGTMIRRPAASRAWIDSQLTWDLWHETNTGSEAALW